MSGVAPLDDTVDMSVVIRVKYFVEISIMEIELANFWLSSRDQVTTVLLEFHSLDLLWILRILTLRIRWWANKFMH